MPQAPRDYDHIIQYSHLTDQTETDAQFLKLFLPVTLQAEYLDTVIFFEVGI